MRLFLDKLQFLLICHALWLLCSTCSTFNCINSKHCLYELHSRMVSKLRKCSSLLQRFFQPSFINGKNNFSSTPVGIIGAPFSKGQPKHGVDLAPDALRNYGLLHELQVLGLDVKDFGDIKFDTISDPCMDKKGLLKFPLEVGAACQKVSEAVRNTLLEKRKCITIGGDHSLGIGTVHGHSLVHDNLCLLWVDAHADINTPKTTYTGHMHGMPLTFLVKELEKYWLDVKGFEWLKPCIDKSKVAFIGLRDIDPPEKLILNKENILHFTMRDIDKYGIFEVTQQALKAINPRGDLSLHVSFDIDSIDKYITPSTGTPVLGGLTLREALCIAEEVCHLSCFRALDIVEVNPSLGTKEQVQNTLEVATLVIKAFLGYSRSGMLPPHMYDDPAPAMTA